MRLDVTRKADLATRVLLELSGRDERTKSADLADAVGTTPGFLTQVVAPLAMRGWVDSEPGPTGGYRAAVALGDVSVLDVIEAVEGPSESGRCVLEDRPCARGSQCALHVPWSRARAQLVAELARTPLATLVRATVVPEARP
jgi:Rrf2 family transcriptional regulator, iron-sulfur cluster assembly transcription factor